MGSRTTMLAVIVALALSAPAAHAQSEPPPALFDAAPTEDAGSADPSDGGRSLLLLGLAVWTVSGAGLLLVLAIRPRRRPQAAAEPAPEPEPEPVVAMPAPIVTEPVPTQRANRFRPTEKRRPKRFQAARATAAEASASVRMGMPVLFTDEPEPAPVVVEKPVWRPRVHSDLPPLPAFGSERPPDP